jgi:hypothetical protein
MAMMAFSIDIGYVVEVRAELVNSADAAALAGVQQLYTPYQQWHSASSSNRTVILSKAVALAKATATAVAGSNSAGDVSVHLVSSDVDVGYTDANGKFYSGNAGQIPSASFPNTVVVTARRDNTSLPNSNGEVPLFFGPVLGKSSSSLTAAATAVAYEATVYDSKSIAGVSGSMLPVAVDQTIWTDYFWKGAASSYVDPNSPSGTPWLQIYPGGTGSSMDGLLSMDGSKAPSTSYYSGITQWIQAGPSSSDLGSLHSTGDLPLPTNGTGQTWASGPGLKSSQLYDFQQLITSPPTPHLLPLYDPTSAGTTTSGNGTYQVTCFVPVYVVYAQGTGSGMDIAVVPAAGLPTFDPTAVVSNILPMGSSSGTQYAVQQTAKLTQ